VAVWEIVLTDIFDFHGRRRLIIERLILGLRRGPTSGSWMTRRGAPSVIYDESRHGR
jgi:hypothetical protein